MKSAQRGRHTSPVEVGNVSQHGFWLLIGDREHFLSFDEFPWFREVSIGKILNVRLPHPGHLYWPELDVDLAVESIERPEDYPLVSRERPNKPLQPPSPPKGASRAPRASRRARG